MNIRDAFTHCNNTQKKIKLDISNFNENKIREVFDSKTGLFNLSKIIYTQIFEWQSNLYFEIKPFDYKKYEIFELDQEDYTKEELKFRIQDKIRIKNGTTCSQMIDFIVKIVKENGENLFFHESENEDELENNEFPQEWKIVTYQGDFWNNDFAINFDNIIKIKSLQNAFEKYECEFKFENKKWLNTKRLWNQLRPKDIKTLFNDNWKMRRLGEEFLWFCKDNKLNFDENLRIIDHEYGSSIWEIREKFGALSILKFIVNVIKQAQKEKDFQFWIVQDYRDLLSQSDNSLMFKLFEQRKTLNVISFYDLTLTIKNWDKL